MDLTLVKISENSVVCEKFYLVYLFLYWEYHCKTQLAVESLAKTLHTRNR